MSKSLFKELNASIYTYENELLQVLINIINNAKDALVLKKDSIEDLSIKINIFQDNKDLVFEIKDNAGGVPIKIIDRIFDPYFTTKGPSSGTGLGLYITKTIVDKHLRGSICVKNNNNGALFIVKIPNLTNQE